MEVLWFCIVAFMLTMYVILDGFDLGAGIIHLFAAKTDAERRSVLNAIGPVWDGNEVWLLAAGGTLYFAYPRLYASSFSGFYLPLIIVLWLLMLRGLGIEFRHRIDHPLWKAFWDSVFWGASALLAVFFGAALGNVVRGVPLNAQGYFFEPLWTTFTVVPDSGILDWFTVIMGLVGLSTLTAHGALYVAMKTGGELQVRCRRIARTAWWGVLIGSLAALVGVNAIRPEVWNNYGAHAPGFLFPLAGAAGLIGMRLFTARGHDSPAFLSSCLFIAGMLASTAFGLFPSLLPASTRPEWGLTVYNSSAHAYGLDIGLIWWSIGTVLVLGYFSYLMFMFRGKTKVPHEGEGY